VGRTLIHSNAYLSRLPITLPETAAERRNAERISERVQQIIEAKKRLDAGVRGQDVDGFELGRRLTDGTPVPHCLTGETPVPHLTPVPHCLTGGTPVPHHAVSGLSTILTDY
jgi:hypothetical protein